MTPPAVAALAHPVPLPRRLPTRAARSSSAAILTLPAAVAQLEALAESYGTQLQDAQARLREHVAQHEPSDEAAKKADEIDAQIQRRSKGGVLV